MKSKAVIYCKYDDSRPCCRDGLRCTEDVYCSHNPNRFNNRKITKGQIIYLVQHGMKEEDVKDLSYLQAGSMIRSIKEKNGEKILSIL